MPACAKLTKNGPIDYQYDYRSGSNRKARPAAFSVLAGGRKPSCFRGFGVVKRWLYGANNPVNYVDPDGLLKRDAQGNLIFVAEGRIERRDAQGRSAAFRPGYLIADDDTRIPAFENLTVKSQPGFNTDCHGLTFADGKYWIEDWDTQLLLDHDGYKKISVNPKDMKSSLRKGDIVIHRQHPAGVQEAINKRFDPWYRKPHNIIHSSTVQRVDGNTVIVEELGGIEVNTTIGPVKNAWTSTTDYWEYYRK